MAKNKNPSPRSQPRTKSRSQLLTSSLRFLCLCSLHLEVPAGYFGILTNLFCESTPVFLQVLFPARLVPHLFCHTACFQCVYVLTTCLLFVPSARLQPPFVSVFPTECHAQPGPPKDKINELSHLLPPELLSLSWQWQQLWCEVHVHFRFLLGGKNAAPISEVLKSRAELEYC